ncbi:unnamed protein product, partial [Staurois parvus]
MTRDCRPSQKTTGGLSQRTGRTEEQVLLHSRAERLAR